MLIKSLALIWLAMALDRRAQFNVTNNILYQYSGYVIYQGTILVPQSCVLFTLVLGRVPYLRASTAMLETSLIILRISLQPMLGTF